MGVQSVWSFQPPPVDPQKVFRDAALTATKEVFELDIVPEAKRLSPVSDAWPSIPEARGEKRRDTGHNRRSIDAVVEDGPNGPEAELFTQSGYGAYLEIGTSKTPARPYLWPAFEKFVGTLAARVKGKLKDFYA